MGTTEGPYTVGGAINFLATPIPEELSADVVGEYGTNNERRIHATGGSLGQQKCGGLRPSQAVASAEAVQPLL